MSFNLRITKGACVVLAVLCLAPAAFAVDTVMKSYEGNYSGWGHQCGAVDGTSDWRTSSCAVDQALIYGPYEQRMQPSVAGQFKARFWLKRNTGTGTAGCVIDVVNADGGTLLGQRTLTYSELTTSYAAYDVDYTWPGPNNRIETRVWVKNTGFILYVDKIEHVVVHSDTAETTLNDSNFTSDTNGWTTAGWVVAGGGGSAGSITRDTSTGNPASSMKSIGSGTTNSSDTCTREGTTLTKTISTAGYTDIRVTYDISSYAYSYPGDGCAGNCTAGLLPGSYTSTFPDCWRTNQDQLVVYYSTNGGTNWNKAQILTERGDNGSEALPGGNGTTWATKTVYLSGLTAVENNANFALQFKTQFNTGYDIIWIDNIKVYGRSTCTPPTAPTNPGYDINNTTTAKIRWTWTDNSTNETGFKVYADPGAGPPTTLQTTTGASVTYWEYTGLSVNTQYAFQVAATNGSCDSTKTANLAKYTQANVPAAPTVAGATPYTLNVTVNENSNPTNTTFAITISGGSYTEGTHWVQADGSIGTSTVWQTDATWGTKTVTGLAIGTTYTFKVKARNGDNVETALSTGASLATLTEPIVAAGGAGSYCYTWKPKRDGPTKFNNDTLHTNLQVLDEGTTSYVAVMTPGTGTMTWHFRSNEGTKFSTDVTVKTIWTFFTAASNYIKGEWSTNGTNYTEFIYLDANDEWYAEEITALNTRGYTTCSRDLYIRYTMYNASAINQVQIWRDTTTHTDEKFYLCGTIVAAPVAPASASNTGPICAGASATLNATGGSGTTLKWYTSSCGGTLAGSGNGLSVSPTTTTTYYARWETPCENSTCAPTTVDVNPLPTAPASAQTDRNNFCADDSGNISLSATGGSGTTLKWYAAGCGSGTSIGSGTPLEIASPTETTTYYARWENSCGYSNCASVTVTVLPLPTTPASAQVDRDNFCADDSGNISLSVTGGSGTTLRWLTGSCGGTSIGTGNPLVIASPTETTIYYARWETSCGNSNCAGVTVTVLPLPTAPTQAQVDRNYFCADDTGNVSLSATGGSGTTLKWYTGGCGSGTSMGTGTPLVIASPTETTTYYARWETSCGNSACASATVTVLPLPVAPVSASNDGPVCPSEAVTLTYSGGSGTTLRWLAGNCNGESVGTGQSLVVYPTQTTTFYARWETSCGTSGCVSTTVTVNPLPAAPTSASNDGPVCAGSSATLSYSGGSGTTLNWYAGGCGSGTPIGSGNNLNVSPTSTTTYYARWETTCGNSTCESTTVTVAANTQITDHPEDQNVVEYGTASFTAAGTGEGEPGYQWQKYNDATETWDDLDGETADTLEIAGAIDDDEGLYRCMVTADCDAVPTDAAELTIAPQILTWESVKVHGSAGEIALAMPAGTPLVEPRRGDLVIRLTFNREVLAADGTLDANDLTIKDSANNSYTPKALAFSNGSQGNELEITLDGTQADRKRLTLELADGKFRRPTSTKAVLAGGRNRVIRYLIGDLDGSGAVNILDCNAFKQEVLQAATADNARCDVNTSGSITIVDLALIKSNLAKTVP